MYKRITAATTRTPYRRGSELQLLDNAASRAVRTHAGRATSAPRSQGCDKQTQKRRARFSRNAGDIEPFPPDTHSRSAQILLSEARGARTRSRPSLAAK